MRLPVLLIPILLSACGDHDFGRLQGYVEGEYVRVAAPLAGRITAISVTRGADIAQNAPLFALEAEREQAAVAEAEHRVAAAQARLADLSKGQRAEELAVIRAQLDQARAQNQLAQAQFKRQSALHRQGVASDAQLDAARADADAAGARVRELQHQLSAAELTARSDEVTAAAEEVKTAQAQLQQASWQLAQKTVAAPVAGRVEEIYFRVGESATMSAPVVSLLPPGNRKLRFFVPEVTLGRLKPGDAMQVQCDGCGDTISAKISFIAANAEFTPPVLYGREQRARLVYLVEALPDAAVALRLHPGQPVDIELSQ